MFIEIRLRSLVFLKIAQREIKSRKIELMICRLFFGTTNESLGNNEWSESLQVYVDLEMLI